MTIATATAPFTQGYLNALRETLPSGAILADETMDRIERDCARAAGLLSKLGMDDERSGRDFYVSRSEGRHLMTFPPLEAYVRDDGKVYLREG